MTGNQFLQCASNIELEIQRIKIYNQKEKSSKNNKDKDFGLKEVKYKAVQSGQNSKTQI